MKTCLRYPMMTPDTDLILDMNILIIAGIHYAFIGHLFGT